ncbi:MAG: cytochrome c [Acidobacteria bacterium]|nr:cytochrome c [Acidobacteriota bacterium]
MMHFTVRSSLVGVTFVAVLGWTAAAASPAAQQKPAAEQQEHDEGHEAGAHHHADAAALANPESSTPASIASGQKLYAANCTNCHGTGGLGDGKMGASMKVKPANLTDASWKHGDTDGEIFTVIKTGIKPAGMRAFSPKLTDKQIWDVVNYVRSIGPAKSH